MHRVYILRNLAGRLYIGVTADIAVRLTQHNAGQSKWTAKYRPWALLWQSDPLSLSDARRLEVRLKAQKGGNGLYQLTGLPKPGS